MIFGLFSGNTCYYEVLGVEGTASSEDIRKAYKSKALKLHPDKNRHRLEEATAEFSHLQQCYSVLIDPHERRWYDNHREQILNKNANIKDDTIIDLMPFFSLSAFKGFGDSPNGFFAIYRRVFEDIEAEEEGLSSRPNNKPSKNESSFTTFGSSSTPYLPTLKIFYDKWTHFYTNKSLSSVEKYTATGSENRDHRRYIEKENKKAREEKKKEYNTTVRSLALFIRKRDPRVQLYMKKTELEEREKPKKPKEKSLHQTAQVDDNFEEPSWSRIDDQQYEMYFSLYREGQEQNEGREKDPDSDAQDFQDSVDAHDTNGSGHEDFHSPSQPSSSSKDIHINYCAACNKTFKSESQWSNHEQSKKHQKQVLLLKKTMAREDKATQRGRECFQGCLSTEDGQKDGIISAGEDVDGPSTNASSREDPSSAGLCVPRSNMLGSGEEGSLRPLEEEFKLSLGMSSCSGSDSDSWDAKPKKNTSRKKRQPANKDEWSPQRQADDIQPKDLKNYKCKTCNGKFSSRNALFAHLKSTGHAALRR